MESTNRNYKYVPLYLIIAVISISAVLIYGSFVNTLFQREYDETVQRYEVLSHKTTELLRNKIEDNFHMLELASSCIILNDKQTHSDLLDLFLTGIKEVGYVDIVMIYSDGKCFNINGDEINLLDEIDGSKLDTNTRQIFRLSNWNGKECEYLGFSKPMIEDNKVFGTIVLIQDTKAIESETISLSYEYENHISTYILNEQKEVISFNDSDVLNDFNYKSIMNQDGRNTLKRYIFPNFFKLNNEDYNQVIWHEKDLGLNQWTVLVGISYTVNPVTLSILQITNILLILLFFSIILLFIVFILFKYRSHKKMIEMVYIDPVTEGDNWYKFSSNVKKILSSKQFHKSNYALITFDINRFKLINDSYGHQKGDEILKDIYGVIQKWVSPSECYTRYAADQYYILIEYKNQEDIEHRIMMLSNMLHKLKYINAGKFYFGVYFINEKIGSDSIDRMADFACHAKNRVKGSSDQIIGYFDEVSRDKLLQEEYIEKAMFDALDNEEFQVYLQPKYFTKEETIAGAEALVRWTNKDGIAISPCTFIPIFEKNGFIKELDMYMIHKICQIQKDWIIKGYDPVPISVNVSRLHFANPQLADTIKQIVDKYEIPHHLIELELTESAFLQNKKMLIDTVTKLRDFDFIVSMDDFGAGYSSLNSLKDIPLDILKLDGELFRSVKEVQRGQTVVRNTISMAKDLDMTVVAECIETREQVDFLSSVGCDIIQGYYYAKPMNHDEFEMTYLQ